MINEKRFLLLGMSECRTCHILIPGQQNASGQTPTRFTTNSCLTLNHMAVLSWTKCYQLLQDQIHLNTKELPCDRTHWATPQTNARYIPICSQIVNHSFQIFSLLNKKKVHQQVLFDNNAVTKTFTWWKYAMTKTFRTRVRNKWFEGWEHIIRWKTEITPCYSFD